MFDYQLARRYGDETLRLLYEHSGLLFADRWAPRIGQLPALLFGMAFAELRRLFQKSSERGASAMQSTIYFARTVSSLMGVYVTALDGPAAVRLWQHPNSFGALPKFLGARASYSACRALMLQPLGVEARLHLALKAALTDLEGFRGLMRESERQDLLTGLLLSDGINECYKLGSEALACADALEKLGTQLSGAAAHRIRMVYHVVRGDRERTEHYRRLIDLHGIQGGTTWQVEWFSVPVEGMAGAFLADSLLARRALVRLERLIKDVPSLVPLRDMVRIAYHFRRGEHERAMFLGEAFLERNPPRSVIGWGPAYAMIANCMVEGGQYERARELLERALAVVTEADRAYFVMYAPLEVSHAVTLFLTGERAEALRRFSEHEARLLAGGEYSAVVVLHEARSRAARLAGDREGYLCALEDMRRTAVASGQPAAVMFADRMAGARTRFTHSSIPPATAAVGGKPAASASDPEPEERTAVAGFLLAYKSSRERSLQALHLLAEASDSQEGYLYLLGAGTPQLAASLQERPPSADLAAQLAAAIERRAASPSVMLQLADAAGDEAHTLNLLADESGSGPPVPVAAAVLRTQTGAPKHVQGRLLRDVARMLAERSDASASVTIRSQR